MAFNLEASTWETGIYQWETTDPLQGGLGGIDNVPIVQLGNRTKYLKDHVDILETYKKKFSAVVVINADVTLTAAAYGKLYVVSGSAGAVNITMPAIIAGQEGFSISFENKSSYAINLLPNGTDTIDSAASKQLTYSGDSLDLVVDESATNHVIKSAILKVAKINSQYTNSSLTTASTSYVDLTSLSFTTPNDGITRRYILDYSASYNFSTSTGNGAQVKILAGATQIAFGENYLSIVSASVDTAKLPVSCKCCVDIAPNTIVKVQVKNVVGAYSNFLNNILIVDEK